MDFRFGISMLVPPSKQEWQAKCRQAEQAGFDVIGVSDHVGLASAFPSLVAAAEVTERVRLNTYMLNAGFYNPTMLARDVATADQLTGGRIEVGIGSGSLKVEFDMAGLDFGTPGERVAHVRRTAEALKNPHQYPQPTQEGGAAVMVAGWGDRMLAVAAELADVVALTGGPTGGPTPTLSPADVLEERTTYVRKFAGERRIELNAMVPAVVITEDRKAAAQELSHQLFTGLTVDEILELPSAIVGTPRECADQIRAHRERFGFTYFTVFEPFLADFAKVIEHLR
ncbi:TIGR03621 family F420-dependent LLM class oxidoreductase [Amycolatopsis sp. cg5]|uniref:TIGR03621 family F420-dependent LLM class oxidoreductase n=1 Tax=Amycolatopsis sp. cg5 TaxID=3238802 RepID=UPI0035261359